MLSKSWLWLNENANLINLLMAQPVGSVAVTTNFGRELHRWHWRSIKVSNGGPKLECGGMGGAHCIKVGRDRQFWELGVFFFFLWSWVSCTAASKAIEKKSLSSPIFSFLNFILGFSFQFQSFLLQLLDTLFLPSKMLILWSQIQPTRCSLSLFFSSFFWVGEWMDAHRNIYQRKPRTNWGFFSPLLCNVEDIDMVNRESFSQDNKSWIPCMSPNVQICRLRREDGRRFSSPTP